jgi:hypothetical protein
MPFTPFDISYHANLDSDFDPRIVVSGIAIKNGVKDPLAIHFDRSRNIRMFVRVEQAQALRNEISKILQELGIEPIPDPPTDIEETANQEVSEEQSL